MINTLNNTFTYPINYFINFLFLKFSFYSLNLWEILQKNSKLSLKNTFFFIWKYKLKTTFFPNFFFFYLPLFSFSPLTFSSFIHRYLLGENLQTYKRKAKITRSFAPVKYRGQSGAFATMSSTKPVHFLEVFRLWFRCL